MTKHDTTPRTVRFPNDLLARLDADADEADGVFSRQVIDAVRAYYARVDAPGRDELETPEPGGRPPFELVGAWGDDEWAPALAVGQQIGRSRAWGAAVDGAPLPRVEVLEFSDAEANGGRFQMSVDGRFAIMARDYDELWRWGWFIGHVMDIAHTVAGAEVEVDDALHDLIQAGWGVVAGHGRPATTFDVTLTFSLPAMGDNDQWAYELRDRVVGQAAIFGAQDIAATITARRPLEIDRRGTPLRFVEIDVDAQLEVISETVEVLGEDAPVPG